MAEKSLHSICRWTFNPGKGGFVPADMRPDWGENFGTPEMIRLVAEMIKPRIPDDVVLGIEMHYDAEVDDNNADAVADALVDNGLYLAMITPGAERQRSLFISLRHGANSLLAGSDHHRQCQYRQS